MLAAVLLLHALTPQSGIVATFSDREALREQVAAEQIDVPAQSTPERAAQDLVEAEGLKSWGPSDPVRSQPGAALKWRARHAGDGREVVVYFAPDRQILCRIRRPRGGLSDAHQRAVRWCAASLGITLPPRQPPVAIGARR